ncbi:MAG TPA: aquaporin [Actinomycetota bacterium]|nr:aquaporin [Actinomycetota bacterium]
MESTGRAAVAELVASFALVFVGAGAVITGGFGLDLTGVALASGLVLAAALAVTARVSWGAANPAVVAGLWVAGRVSSARAVSLILAQLLGAIAAGLLLRYVAPGTAFDAAAGGTPALASGIASGKGVVVEAATSFLLVFTVFGVIVHRHGAPDGTAGLAVGLVLAADILAFGPYTGAAVNPARWLGPALASGTWADWFVWILGPIAGAVVAAVLYQVVFVAGSQPDTP